MQGEAQQPGPTGAANSGCLHLRVSLVHPGLKLELCRHMCILWLAHGKCGGRQLLRSKLHCRLDGGTKGAPAPAADSAGMAVVQELGEAVHTQVQAYIAAMEARKIREGSRLAMAVSSIGEGFTCFWCEAWHTLGGWHPPELGTGSQLVNSIWTCPGRLSWQRKL